jgi:hypothetical protein
MFEEVDLEVDSRIVEVYGNISPEKFANVEKFTYLCNYL